LENKKKGARNLSLSEERGGDAHVSSFLLRPGREQGKGGSWVISTGGGKLNLYMKGKRGGEEGKGGRSEYARETSER